MKKALIVYYSQAGQTERAVEHLERGLGGALATDKRRLEPEEPFKFPWSMRNFFRAFPRCVQSVAPRTRPLDLCWDDYDLVLLAYPVWFLSPALPMQGFLLSEEARGLRGKTVITVATCRNLPVSAGIWMKDHITALGGHFAGQIAACELAPMWASFVTTPRWMLTGHKDAFWFFPPAGLSDSSYAHIEATAAGIGQAWAASNGDPSRLTAPGSNLNRVSLLLMDRIGHDVFFRPWSRLVLRLFPKPGLGQDLLLVLFRISLVVLIICGTPCIRIFEWSVRNSSSWIRKLGLNA
jgi:hypothetical protein